MRRCTRYPFAGTKGGKPVDARSLTQFEIALLNRPKIRRLAQRPTKVNQ